jgi:hypothetical protein
LPLRGIFAGRLSLDKPVYPAQIQRRKTEIKTMKTHSFFSQVCHSPIYRLAAVTLVALAWSSLAFCGEIQDAAKSGDLEKVKALLKDNPNLVTNKNDNLDMNGRTPLYWAASHGHKDVAELLLANKAEVNAKNKLGYTPLHGAASQGHGGIAVDQPGRGQYQEQQG